MPDVKHVLDLAARGFYVFPIRPQGERYIDKHGKEQIATGKMPPAVKNWQAWATRDPEKIKAHWAAHSDDNIGIATSKFGDGQALLVVDVDNKGDKHGDHELLRLELAGWDLPRTFTQITPTGGRHLVYSVCAPVRQGANVLGDGLDVRSRGGYIVAAGSHVAAGQYKIANACGVGAAPAWLIDRCGRPRERVQGNPPSDHPADINPDAASARARHYLEHEAPLAVEGQGGDETAYKVAARLKDFGVPLAQAQELMDAHWNARCSPPWSPDELGVKVNNAYQYGQEAPGSAAPEAVFPPVQQSAAFAEREQAHPFERLNQEFAFTVAGGGSHILWETHDEKGRSIIQHLDIGTFHRKHASWKMKLGKKDEKITELWMEHPTRRSYDGICFQPGRTCNPKFYNLWRGFAYTPDPHYDGHPAVEAWIDHLKHNVCAGSDTLFRWLRGYFAHIVQRPEEKPLVALVLRGGKGVGKNAVVERVGALLGGHFLVTSNRRYLVGNFNGHMENLLLFALDEAFWSGDKQAEGQLKDLITGAQHVIEHKGKEPYAVDNKTRVIILGNEDWLAPASHDERRFAVFNVADGRKGDRQFFQSMREGMEAGGYRALLRYLLDVDLSEVDVNEAPLTAGLLEQKHATLEPLEQWWLNCLTEGKIIAGDFENDFGRPIECERFRDAFRRDARERSIRSRLPDDRTFGRILKQICSIIVPGRQRESNRLVNTYRLPTLAEARACWDRFIGHPVEWPE